VRRIRGEGEICQVHSDSAPSRRVIDGCWLMPRHLFFLSPHHLASHSFSPLETPNYHVQDFKLLLLHPSNLENSSVLKLALCVLKPALYARAPSLKPGNSPQNSFKPKLVQVLISTCRHPHQSHLSAQSWSQFRYSGRSKNKGDFITEDPDHMYVS
jgi:hypothetical protein